MKVNDSAMHYYIQMKEFIEEIESHGFIENRFNNNKEYKCDKVKSLGIYRICLDTKLKLYETFIWKD